MSAIRAGKEEILCLNIVMFLGLLESRRIRSDVPRKSAQELHVEYQTEAFFINFSVSSAEKGCREGPGFGILHESLVKATISQQ